jgi:acyl carrier protein
MPPAEARRMFTRLVDHSPLAQVGVLRVDWPRYAAAAPAARMFVSRLMRTDRSVHAGRSGPRSAEPALAERVAAAPATSQEAVVTAHVRACVLRALGLPDAYALDVHQGLRDIGLDSLMAVEIRNVLASDVGAPLPATLAFDYPTVAALARYLFDEVLRVPRLSAAKPGLPDEAPRDATSSIDALSEEEAARQLAAELAGLEHDETHDR